MKKKEIEIPQIKIFLILKICIIPNLSFDFNLKSKDLTNHNKRDIYFVPSLLLISYITDERPFQNYHLYK